MQHNNIETERLQERWTLLLNHLSDDPQLNDRWVQMMNSRIGQYLNRHPFLALTLMIFIAMSALPVGLFLIFALVTITMLAVGFVFFGVFVLFGGGLILLCVLSGIAFFSVILSFILKACYITISNILTYYPQLTKQCKIWGKESCFETSQLKEKQ